MSESRNTRVPADGDRAVSWVVRELALPAIVKACVSCRAARHRPTGKFRVNANGKLLDVWMLICCEHCGRTSKIPVHERVNVRALAHERLVAFENNDPAVVRQLAMDTALAGRSAYQLDWNGTWELETGGAVRELEYESPAGIEVVVRFELPAPIRVGKLLTAGLGRSRSAVISMVESGRIRLPMSLEARVRGDFTFVISPPPPPREAAADQPRGHRHATMRPRALCAGPGGIPDIACPRLRLGGVTAYARIGSVQHAHLTCAYLLTVRPLRCCEGCCDGTSRLGA